MGSFATQLCLHRGARVIATASSHDISYLRNLGVEQVIDYKTERFDEKIKDMDAVLDLVGGETLARSYQVVKQGGVLVTTVESIDESEAAQRGIRAFPLMMTRSASDLVELAQLMDQGVLRLI